MVPEGFRREEADRGSSRGEIWAWAFYDFANSAYYTSVVSVIFNVYFVQVVASSGLEIAGKLYSGSSLWGFSVSLSMLTIFLVAPVLGAIADFSATKKRFLFYFTYAGVAATAGLYWAGPGDVWWALSFFMLANLCVHGSQSFYNAFLSEITVREKMGEVSGFGWALGYLGGLLCLGLNLGMLQYPGWFGLPEEDHVPVRVSLLVVAAWWGLFALPLFLRVRERAVSPPARSQKGYVREGFRRLASTLSRVRDYRELVKFLLAFLLYNDGIQTVIVMAAVFAAEVLGMSSQELILCFIMIQAVAFFGALGFGVLSRWMSGKAVILLSLVVWSAAVSSALFIRESWHFWVLGAVVGLVLGGNQSASRALFAQFTPAGKSAEFFGFYGTSEKASSILGPAFFGLAVHLTGTSRYAIVSLLVFFLAGMAVLWWVDEEAGLVRD